MVWNYSLLIYWKVDRHVYHLDRNQLFSKDLMLNILHKDIKLLLENLYWTPFFCTCLTQPWKSLLTFLKQTIAFGRWISPLVSNYLRSRERMRNLSSPCEASVPDPHQVRINKIHQNFQYSTATFHVQILHTLFSLTECQNPDYSKSNSDIR